MKGNIIEGTVHRLRYVSLIAVIASGFGSVLMFIVGASKTGLAYTTYFSSGIGPQDDLLAKKAISYLIQATDVFLIGLILMIFAGGIYKLFISRLESESSQISSWVKVRSIAELKRILAELVIVILFVKFLEGGLEIGMDSYSWEMLVLPLGILMLALALKFMRLRE